MGFGNRRNQASLDSMKKYCRAFKREIICVKFTTRKIIFPLLYGLFLTLNYFILRYQFLLDLSVAYRPIIISPKRTNVLAVSTGPNVPLITVNLYYLPLNASNTAIHHALEEHVYETSQNGHDYPIGAHLLSDPYDYTIPSDRIPDTLNNIGIKYFQTMRGGHYHLDARYGKPSSTNLSDSERVVVLRGLLAAWMNFTDEKQIPSWIAHGILIGWWWGGSFLPWDTDVDIQINANFLYVLARFNNTVLSDRYLINVNPHFRARQPQPENFVDARLIDKATGYFIDISGMAVTGMNVSWEPRTLLLSDKRIDKYFYSDLHPLVRITFEGIATWRPYNTEQCLVQEYGSQVVRSTSYQGYTYSVVDARWIKNGTLLANSPHPIHALRNAAKVKHAVQTGRKRSINRANDPSIFSRSSRKISPGS